MAIFGRGNVRLTLLIDDKVLLFEQGQITDYYRQEIPDHQINVFYTDELIAAFGGRRVLEANPRQFFTFNLNLRYDTWQFLRRAQRQQQLFASLGLPAGIQLLDEYRFREVDGSTPDRARVIGTEIDTTSPMGDGARFFPIWSIFILPFPVDVEANFYGGIIDDPNVNDFGLQIQMTAVELQDVPFAG